MQLLFSTIDSIKNPLMLYEYRTLFLDDQNTIEHRGYDDRAIL